MRTYLFHAGSHLNWQSGDELVYVFLLHLCVFFAWIIFELSATALLKLVSRKYQKDVVLPQPRKKLRTKARCTRHLCGKPRSPLKLIGFVVVAYVFGVLMLAILGKSYLLSTFQTLTKPSDAPIAPVYPSPCTKERCAPGLCCTQAQMFNNKPGQHHQQLVELKEYMISEESYAPSDRAVDRFQTNKMENPPPTYYFYPSLFEHIGINPSSDKRVHIKIARTVSSSCP
mmetsp:Transcript_10568/g.15879  ORF Transcript_10568/g.15879 Transcript_10568/m.15879 type:complete len:228 (+) Transcript_10568:2-685(+)